MAKLVSSTYGDALFELALEENKLDRIHEEIMAVRQAFLANGELNRLLRHPKVIKEEKLAFLDQVFSGRISEEVLGFLRIVVQKDRQQDFLSIFDYFLHKVKEYRGIGTAYVTSALPLSDRQKQAVEKKLLETTHYDSFEMHYEVRPGILGGLVIRIGGRVVDSSLKTQIDRLSRQLSQVRLSEE